MTERIYCQRLTELKKEKKFLEKSLSIKITIKGKMITMEGDALNEYEALMVLDAINLGFSAQTASLLQNESYTFEKINIKDYTRRKDLDVIRGRLIGTHGKTKKTIEQISHCAIKIKDNLIGIIGPADEIQYALTAITNIIKGTKQTNAYRYLERINTEKKKRRE
jgi:ribosomal RNA assembly protein